MAKTRYFSKDSVCSAEATESQRRELCEGLVKIRDRWCSEGWNLEIATCAEGFNLEEYGISHNRCIDDVLLRRLFAHDEALMKYLGAPVTPRHVQNSLMDILPARACQTVPLEPNPKLKDKGQRKACGCITAKDIGMYDTCAHFCSYCYANTSEEAVRHGLEQYDPDRESIILH